MGHRAQQRAYRPQEPEGSHPPPQHRLYDGSAMNERYEERAWARLEARRAPMQRLFVLRSQFLHTLEGRDLFLPSAGLRRCEAPQGADGREKPARGPAPWTTMSPLLPSGTQSGGYGPRDSPNRKSDDALLGEALHVVARAAEQLGQHPLVVFAIARRAAVGRAADIGRRGAELHRQFIDRPGADLGAGDLGQPFQVAELRIAVNAVLRVLAHAGRHAGALQFHHAVIA